jgi:hypothetical protein
MEQPLSRVEVEVAGRLEQLLGLLGLLHQLAGELLGGPAYDVAEALIADYRRRLSCELAALESAALDERAARVRRDYLGRANCCVLCPCGRELWVHDCCRAAGGPCPTCGRVCTQAEAEPARPDRPPSA